MEKLELNAVPPGSNSWKPVNLTSNQANVGYDAMLYQLSSKEIIIFRGDSSTDTYLFNITENTIKTYTDAKIKPIGEYHRGYKYKCGNSIYSVGFNGHLHIFNPKERSCTSKPFGEIKQ